MQLIGIRFDLWSDLDAYMGTSQLSRSRVQQDSSGARALKRIRDFDELGKDMVLSSPGSRYVLKADISRFYPTLYTHSIPWALHTKEVAKAKKKDSSLLGNLIDSATQATQHQQTLGIPVG